MLQSKKGPVTKLREEVKRLQEEVERYQKDYLKALADLDNYRKRKEKELEIFREYANEGLLSELIPVLDNFDRALKNPPEADEANPESFYKGIEIILKQLKEVLEKKGLKEYSSLGKEFDPKFHEGLGYVETNEKPPNVVVKEVAKGYLLKERVLRPAKVIVAKEKKGE